IRPPPVELSFRAIAFSGSPFSLSVRRLSGARNWAQKVGTALAGKENGKGACHFPFSHFHFPNHGHAQHQTHAGL
ncbi:MAG: hypothetical protein ACRD6I_18215, partial [Candidatus Acidiferrales bacterium]